MAVVAGARGAANAMDVVFRHVRHVEIDDLRQLADVEPARGDLGRDERREMSGLEVGQRSRARRLALVAMDGGGADAGAAQLLGEAVRAVLGAREHERLLPAALAIGAILEEMHEEMALVVFRDAKCELDDAFDRAVRRRHFDLNRIHEDARGERADVRRVSRGEHQVLPLRWQELDDSADIVDEAHVEHAVGFVEHEMLDLGEIGEAAVRKVEQPSRRCDQDVAADPKAVNLRPFADTAEDHARAQLLVRSIDADALQDLGREFAGRREHERARSAARGGLEQLQQGQHEGRGLAGAGLGAGQQVASAQHWRDGSGLDRRGGRVAVGANCRQQLGLEPEFIEIHDVFWIPGRGRRADYTGTAAPAL